MRSEELKRRTRTFGLQVIRLVQTLPREKVADVIGWQLLRSATSIGANYRAACRARSQAEFISKIGVVEEEADGSCYWLEVLLDTKLGEEQKVSELLREAKELTAIFTASGRTAKENRK